MQIKRKKNLVVKRYRIKCRVYYICKMEFHWGVGEKQDADLSYFRKHVLTGDCKAKSKRNGIYILYSSW